jgi:RNA polymerase sigma-70 factor (ECF subfamily)
MTSTPISLLERLREPGDADAWKQFVALYTPLLFYWSKKLGLASADAADHVQDVFLLLIRKMPHFRPDATRRFRAWLWTIFLNRFRESLRKPAPVQPLESDRLDELAARDELSAIDDADYRSILVRQALTMVKAHFHASTWQACWISVTTGKSAEQVSAELGMTPAAVRAAKYRVLSWLRRELQEMLD